MADPANVRTQVAKEIAAAIQDMDLPKDADPTADKAWGFYTARAVATAIARSREVEGGQHPRDMVDVVTGGGA